MKNNINIFEYKNEDKEEIKNLINEIIMNEYKYYFWDKWLKEKDWSLYDTNNKDNKLYYIKESNKIVSVCSVCKKESNIYYINTFYTKKEYIEKGYGTILFDKCYDFAVKNNATKILLCVDKYFKNAIKFYEKRGFVLFDEKEINELWYQKIMK